MVAGLVLALAAARASWSNPKSVDVVPYVYDHPEVYEIVTARTTPVIKTGFSGIAYGNGALVAVGGDGHQASIISTRDYGDTWNLFRPTEIQGRGDADPPKVCFGGGAFALMIGSSDTKAEADRKTVISQYSLDGIVWQNGGNIEHLHGTRKSALWDQFNFPGYGCVYGNMFVLMSSGARKEDTNMDNRAKLKVDVSPYGTAWSRSSDLMGSHAPSVAGEFLGPVHPLRFQTFQSIAYGNNQFVAVSFDTTAHGQGGSDLGVFAYTSPNGNHWTSTADISSELGVPKTTDATDVWGSMTFGSGLFVMVSRCTRQDRDPLFPCNTTGKLATSPDGATWTLRTLPASKGAIQWNSIAAGGGMFVAVGQLPGACEGQGGGAPPLGAEASCVPNATVCDSGKCELIITSTDGINWNPAPAHQGIIKWDQVTFGDGKFIVIASEARENTNDTTLSTTAVRTLTYTVPVPGVPTAAPAPTPTPAPTKKEPGLYAGWVLLIVIGVIVLFAAAYLVYLRITTNNGRSKKAAMADQL